jgi:cytochrome c
MIVPDILAGVPIPRDIPLPLPVDGVVLQGLLVLLFLAHILFVLLMVGGSILTLVCEFKGMKSPDYDVLAREIGKTITVNKSLAVVLGVAPLLGINVLYTTYFYSSNALTGTAWIGLVPLVVAAFLLTYAHKYSWGVLSNAKPLHISLGAMATVLFLFIPLVFLANINLMLFPDKWTQTHGWLSTLAFPNVLPRYLHFLLACIAVTGLFLLAYFTRAGYPVESTFQHWDRPKLRRGFYSVAFGATLAQFVAGPLLFFTLPAAGMSWHLTLVIAVGIAFAVMAMLLLWREIQSDVGVIGRRFAPVVGLLAVIVLCMGYGRHVYRESAVTPHRNLMRQQSEDFRLASTAARYRALAGVKEEKLPLGESVYRQVCASCHVYDRVVVGPPMKEIATIYAGNPDGIVKWANAPARKRPGFAVMPAFRIGDQKLKAVAEYMLRVGSGQEPPPGQATTVPAASMPAATTQAATQPT